MRKSSFARRCVQAGARFDDSISAAVVLSFCREHESHSAAARSTSARPRGHRDRFLRAAVGAALGRRSADSVQS